MPAEYLSSDQPLAFPSQTLVAVKTARDAAQRARRTLELSLAPALAGGALAAVGIGANTIVDDSGPLPDWVQWILVGLAALMSLGGLVLIYWNLWAWIRRSRLGGRNSPLSDGCAQLSGGQRFRFLAILMAAQFVGFLIFQALRGYISNDVYYGILIWGTRLAVSLAVGFYLYRFVRSALWEHLVFAAGIAGTLGLYIFANPGWRGTMPLVPTLVAAMSILTTLIAAASLIARWRRWARATQAAAIDAAAGAEAT